MNSFQVSAEEASRLSAVPCCDLSPLVDGTGWYGRQHIGDQVCTFTYDK